VYDPKRLNKYSTVGRVFAPIGVLRVRSARCLCGNPVPLVGGHFQWVIVAGEFEDRVVLLTNFLSGITFFPLGRQGSMFQGSLSSPF
jgi:hypothetical protein